MNKKKIIIILIALGVFILPIVIAGTFTCTSNTCTGGDAVTFSDSPSLHSSLLPAFHDMVTFSDKSIHFTTIFKFIDKVVFSDVSSLFQQAFVTITITITNTVTSISSCSAQSCFVNPVGNNFESLIEELVVPLGFIVATVFGFIYVGLRFFGIIVIVATFIILGLAYIGIIPSYFSLLTIIMIGGAIVKMVSSLIGDRQ